MNIILIHIGNSKVDYLLNTVRHYVHFNNKNLFLLAIKKLYLTQLMIIKMIILK